MSLNISNPNDTVSSQTSPPIAVTVTTAGDSPTHTVQPLTERRDSSGGRDLQHQYFFDGELTVALAECLVSRNRLYDLFHLIEKEFDALYTENIALRAKVEVLTAGPSEALLPDEALDPALAGPDKCPAAAGKNKTGSQMSQKLKTAFRVPPGRLVSSFRGGDLRVRPARVLSGHSDGVWDVAAQVASGRTVVGSASADQTARLWDAETGVCFGQYLGHSGSVNAVRLLPLSAQRSRPGELTVVTASGDRTAHVWHAPLPPPGHNRPGASEDEQDGSEVMGVDGNDENVPTIKKADLELTGHLGVVAACDWLCDGEHVITASWDRTANIYDLTTGQITNMLSGHDSELTHTSAHGTAKLVVTASKDSTFRLWDFRESIHSVAVFQGHSEAVTSAVFAGAERVVSGSDDRCVKVWDLRNMRSPLASIRLDSPVNRLAVSARHNVIAIPHDNRQVRLYDLSGTRIARLPRSSRRGHRRVVCGTAWADDGQGANLFTCGFDRAVIGWRFG